jgi:hypothetical protein
MVGSNAGFEYRWIIKKQGILSNEQALVARLSGTRREMDGQC